MNTRTVGLSRFCAASCAIVITAVGAWAFVDSTASVERDPFQFASFMAANASAHSSQPEVGDGDHFVHEVRVYGLFDHLVPLPLCLGECA